MSAYLCSDDTLNALSTFYYMKSGKTDEERKSNIGGIIMSLEMEILDDKYSGKDLSRINSVIAKGRTYWKS